MAESIIEALGLTVADVKLAMGLQADNTTQDTYIANVIRDSADLLIEDWFTLGFVMQMTPDQKRRAVKGLALCLAADCLLVMPVDMVLSAGDSESVHVGPLSISNTGWGGNRNLGDLRSLSNILKSRGESILTSLKLANATEYLSWSAVGTTVKPRYTGGPRRGLPYYGNH